MRLDSTQDPPGPFLSSFLKGGTRAKCFCGVHRHRSFTSIFYDANFFVSGFRKRRKTLIEDRDEVNDCAYRNDPIQRLGRLFSLGKSREDVYSNQGAYSGQGTFFFLEKHQNVQNKAFIFYLKRIERTGKRTCCPWIILSKNDQPNNNHHKILRSLV